MVELELHALNEDLRLPSAYSASPMTCWYASDRFAVYVCAFNKMFPAAFLTKIFSFGIFIENLTELDRNPGRIKQDFISGGSVLSTVIQLSSPRAVEFEEII